MSRSNMNKFIVKGNLSDFERLKEESNYLRGSISEDLEDGLTGGFRSDNSFLIRFHGMYQQDDRDIRAERALQKLEPRYAMMLRCRLPGGVISTKQWLKVDNLATSKTIYNTIRLTNRQTFQLHGIVKKNLKYVHQGLKKVGLDALATANDVNRNVVCTSNSLNSDLYKEVYVLAKKISEHFLPRTSAYEEIWLDQKKSSFPDFEPILGKTYLPRKFKIALVIPPDNDVDLHANDLSFVAIEEFGKLVGFNLLIGGGLSIEYGNKTTYPQLAFEVGYFPLEKILDVAEAVVTIQRDWGNRVDRKNAKTRYTLNRVGFNNFKEEMERRSGTLFSSIRPYQLNNRSDFFGWIKNSDKKYSLTIFIKNGRLFDSSEYSLKTGISEIAKIHEGEFHLTSSQNLIVFGISEKQKEKIQKIVNRYKLMENISVQSKNSMACVAFPTCPLAMAEAERFLPYFLIKLEEIMQKYGICDEYIVVRISGCSNGCGRTMLAELGLLGRALNRYNIYIGGNRAGTRISRIYKKNISVNELIVNVDILIKFWAKERNEKEEFGDFVIRKGIIKPVSDPKFDFWEQ